MRNIQAREFEARTTELGYLFDDLTTVEETVWPAPAWPMIELDRGLQVGARGGHSVIRYTVTGYEAGTSVRFSFDRGVGLDGYHELRIIDAGGGRSRLVHTIEARLEGTMAILWPLMIRWLHEALLQDLLDNAERRATGTLEGKPARWSLRVRLFRRIRRSSAKVSPARQAQRFGTKSAS